MGIARRVKRVFFEPKLFERPSVGINLSDGELKHIQNESSCPYCHSDLYQGAEAGMCTNLLCSNHECQALINYCGWVGQYMGKHGRL